MAGVNYLVYLFAQSPSIWVAERVLYKGLADQGESTRDNVVPRGWPPLGAITTLVLKRQGGKWLLEPERKL